jgi:hypothetical protein
MFPSGTTTGRSRPPVSLIFQRVRASANWNHTCSQHPCRRENGTSDVGLWAPGIARYHCNARILSNVREHSNQEVGALSHTAGNAAGRSCATSGAPPCDERRRAHSPTFFLTSFPVDLRLKSPRRSNSPFPDSHCKTGIVRASYLVLFLAPRAVTREPAPAIACPRNAAGNTSPRSQESAEGRTRGEVNAQASEYRSA